MRLNEFNSVGNKKVGREYNHLEDLVFIEGNSGISRAIQIIENLKHNNENVSIKWDGNPTIFWGRDEQGNFVLTGKNGWGKNKSTDKENLREFVLSSGKGEEWRNDFASILVNAFEVLERNTPQNIRGYFYGDLLWHSGSPFSVTENTLFFTPNKVTYVIQDPSLKQEIQKSSIGIAVHKFYETFGSKTGEMVTNADQLNTCDVKVFSQEPVKSRIEVEQTKISEILDWQLKYGHLIDEFLQERKGLSDLKNILYTYVNQTVKNKNLENLSHGFYEWLPNSKVSKPKQIRISELDRQYGDMIETILEGVFRIMNIKNSIIEQLDNQQQIVNCMIAEDSGGEGYISVNSFVKLVPRHRWIPN